MKTRYAENGGGIDLAEPVIMDDVDAARADERAATEALHREFYALHGTSPAEQDEFQEAVRERMVKVLNKIEDAFTALIAYQVAQAKSRKCTPKHLLLSTRAMALALGFTPAAGAAGSAELGRLCGFGKETARKCLDLFLTEKLRLPPLPGQRTSGARENMTNARLQQLSKGDSRATVKPA